MSEAAQSTEVLSANYAVRVRQMRKALMEAVTVEDVKEIARAMLEKAREGCFAAGKLLFAYLMGKPGKAETYDESETPIANGSNGTADLAPRQEPKAAAPSANGTIHGVDPASLGGVMDHLRDIRAAAPHRRK